MHRVSFPLNEMPLICSVCGNDTFTRMAILWDALVDEWNLSPRERAYIDDQQGLHCDRCKSNLRSITLASAIMSELGISASFRNACESNPMFREQRVLEVNGAGALSPYLAQLPRRLLASYPQYDLQHLPFADASFDIVVHSDTLEHVPNGVLALKECRRVLRPKGFLACTIPIIPDRLTKHRDASIPSYHGNQNTTSEDYLVYREYGGDFWTEFFEAGFSTTILHSLVYPASIAVIGRSSI